MKEIGGYLELEKFNGPLLHEGAVALNCGRNCLAYLIRANRIKKLYLPYFCCDSVIRPCRENNVELGFYHIDKNFRPMFDKNLGSGEWMYIVNLYGQIGNDEVLEWKRKYRNVIFDNAQAYFQMPAENVDTLYTCRKFFGVTDGAFLYTEAKLEQEFEIDVSYDRMEFLLGRFERTASEFYPLYVANNQLFKDQPIKQMSLLTRNLLRGVDYDRAKDQRTRNFEYLHKHLGAENQLDLRVAEGAFAYPLLIENGYAVRKRLALEKIYIPTLWPNVLEQPEDSLEYRYAKDILPIPCDQRYGEEDMEYICEMIRRGA